MGGLSPDHTPTVLCVADAHRHEQGKLQRIKDQGQGHALAHPSKTQQSLPVSQPVMVVHCRSVFSCVMKLTGIHLHTRKIDLSRPEPEGGRLYMHVIVANLIELLIHTDLPLINSETASIS